MAVGLASPHGCAGRPIACVSCVIVCGACARGVRLRRAGVSPRCRCARSRHQLPSRQAGGEPPRPPCMVLSRTCHTTSSAPYFTPERGWSAPAAGATGPGGAIIMLSARDAAATAVFRAALGRKKRVQVAVRVGRVRVTRQPFTYVSAHRCVSCGVLRAVELSTHHSPYAFYNTDKRGRYSMGGCNKGRNRCPSASRRAPATAAGHVRAPRRPLTARCKNTRKKVTGWSHGVV